MRNLLVAQSGGPTSAINATIAGVIMEAHASDQVDTIYGAVNGIKGVLEERFVNLSEKVPGEDELEILCQTPAAALGSCRVKLKNPAEDDSQFQEVIRIFRKHEIMYFIYAGGNDSMDTVDKLAAYCKEHKIEDIHVMGAPKTIDNDLVGTDHCPGFGSAAKYIATTFSELERDCHVYDTKAVTIVEVMGRNAGWLTAASALARNNGAAGPSLIYLCEPAFSVESFLDDVKKKLEQQDSVLVAISEGIKDKNGVYISEQVQSGAVDNFGHSYIAGSARVLEDIVRREIGCKVRSIELNLMQRCSAHIASKTDIDESFAVGTFGAQQALMGVTGKMAVILREETKNGYHAIYGCEEIERCANHERLVPEKWYDLEDPKVQQEIVAYIRPLIKGKAVSFDDEYGTAGFIDWLKFSRQEGR